MLDIFAQFAEDEDKKVRGAVVQALLYTEWPEALPLLEKMAAEDKSPEIRDYAGGFHISGATSNSGSQRMASESITSQRSPSRPRL